MAEKMNRFGNIEQTKEDKAINRKVYKKGESFTPDKDVPSQQSKRRETAEGMTGARVGHVSAYKVLHSEDFNTGKSGEGPHYEHDRAKHYGKKG